jgi:hypothetical protein
MNSRATFRPSDWTWSSRAEDPPYWSLKATIPQESALAKTRKPVFSFNRSLSSIHGAEYCFDKVVL